MAASGTGAVAGSSIGFKYKEEEFVKDFTRCLESLEGLINPNPLFYPSRISQSFQGPPLDIIPSPTISYKLKHKF